MKKYLLIVSLVLLAMAPARAQKGLQIDSLFSKAVPITGYEESLVKGSALRDYNLSYFRSFRFPADKALIDRIATRIGEKSISQQKMKLMPCFSSTVTNPRKDMSGTRSGISMEKIM